MDSAPPQTAPSATLPGKGGPSPSTPHGVCSCGSTGLAECTCEWGRLIRDLIRAGYALTASQAADELVELRSRAERVMTGQRRKLLARLAQEWQGPVGGFLERFGISRATYDGYGLCVPKENRRPS